MTVFKSTQEKRYWLYVILVLITLIFTLVFSQPLFERLFENQDVQAAIFLMVMFLIIIDGTLWPYAMVETRFVCFGHYSINWIFR